MKMYTKILVPVNKNGNKLELVETSSTNMVFTIMKDGINYNEFVVVRLKDGKRIPVGINLQVALKTTGYHITPDQVDKILKQVIKSYEEN